MKGLQYVTDILVPADGASAWIFITCSRQNSNVKAELFASDKYVRLIECYA
jgi:hypothetical protein